MVFLFFVFEENFIWVNIPINSILILIFRRNLFTSVKTFHFFHFFLNYFFNVFLHLGSTAVNIKLRIPILMTTTLWYVVFWLHGRQLPLPSLAVLDCWVGVVCVGPTLYVLMSVIYLLSIRLIYSHVCCLGRVLNRVVLVGVIGVAASSR